CLGATPVFCSRAWERAVGPSLPSPQFFALPATQLAAAAPLGRRLGGGRPAPAVLRHPFLRLRRAAVIHGDVIAALVLEVPRHRVPHDAETEKSHLRHTVLPRALPCDRANTYIRE